MTLKELVKGKKVRFKFYRDGELWYETDDGSSFLSRSPTPEPECSKPRMARSSL